MTRPKLYSCPAERQRAYRQRLQAKLKGVLPASSSTRKKTRPQRLQVICASLHQLADEYQHWLDSLPDNLADSDLASHLQETVEQLLSFSDELNAIDLPKGFGR